VYAGFIYADHIAVPSLRNETLRQRE